MCKKYDLHVLYMYYMFSKNFLMVKKLKNKVLKNIYKIEKN